MSVYPMSVVKETLDHKGGTKSFHLMRILTGTGKAVLVTRWGKTGAFGQFKVERFDSAGGANLGYDKKRKEKIGGGYRPNGEEMSSVHNVDDLRRLLGIGYFSQFGPENLRHLDPVIDTTGVRGSKIDYDEDGNKVDSARRVDPRILEEARLREEEEARRREQEAYQNNPLFGLF